MAYELLIGRTPFQGALPQALPHMHANIDPQRPSAINVSLAPFDAIVSQALAKKPEDRFTSVKEFASAFADACKPRTKQPHEILQLPLQQEPVDPRQTTQQPFFLPIQQLPPHPRLVETQQLRQPSTSPQQKGLLSSQAYQFATTYQLGTPLEEFRVIFKNSRIFTEVSYLITLIPTAIIASDVTSAVIAVIIMTLAILATIWQSQLLELSIEIDENLILLLIIIVVLLALLIVVSVLSAEAVQSGAIAESLVFRALIAILSIGELAGAAWFILYLKFHRSWRVYLYSGGFVYTHGKQIDVCLWNQIRKAEKAQSSLRYIIIRRDSKKIVLKPIFLSLEYLGDYIIRECERINRSE
jgi:hypothetical protein